jgi:DNA helicase-2/ATP-dependent DNA helicase PcrA
LPLNDKQPTLEELRVRYVALSRACEELWAFPAPKSEPWIRDPRLDDRLFRTSWRNKGLTTAIEVRPSDLEAARPAGTGIAAAPAPEVQNHLATNVRRGDPIELRLAHVRQTDSATPIYAAVHGGQIVGQTSDRFGEILAARLRHQGHEQAWPALLLGARCDGVETVIGLPGEGQAAEIGSTGFWLRPRLAGTAELERNHEEDG